MKKIFLLSILAFSTILVSGQAQLKPGSGNTLDFDGTDDFVTIPSVDGVNNFDFGDNFTIEVWVKINPVQDDIALADNSILEKWDQSSARYPYVIRYRNQTDPFNAGEIFVARYDGTHFPQFTSGITIGDGQWHHIAFTRTGGPTTGVLSLYIDGILRGTTPDDTDANTTSTAPLCIGQRATGSNRFKGNADEVRIWNVGLTQTQVRDRMCKKITGTDPLIANLTAYYNLDETAGATAFDGSANANNGTLTNGPVRTVSGAAIGDNSAHNYVTVGFPAANVSYAAQDNLAVTYTTFNPAFGPEGGTQVYVVNEKPSSQSGITGVGGNNRYFGVFNCGLLTPQYDAVYNYTGNPFISPTDEPTLVLYKRADNSVAGWFNSAATLNTAANTLTVTGESTEYMVGSSSAPLPIVLSEFTARKTSDNRKTDLIWVTAFEQNVSHFDIQRSTDGINYVTIGRVNAKNITNGASYFWQDAAPSQKNNYYRLNTVDIDATAKLSPVRIIRFTTKENVLVYPTVSSDVVFVQSEKQVKAQLINMTGLILQTKVVKGSATFDLSALPSGTYLIRIADNDQLFKIMKQ